MDESRYGNQDAPSTLTMIRDMDERRGLESERDDWLACEPLDDILSEPSNDNTPTVMPSPWLRRGRFSTIMHLSILLMALFAVPASAVLIEFDNCLSEDVQQNAPLQLQFVPLFVDAKFNTTDPSHELQVTVWGNVTGSGTTHRFLLPPPNDPYWRSNETNEEGKIQDLPEPTANSLLLTTLSNKVNVLTYEPWAHSFDFCNSLINASCPLGPSFFANAYGPLFHSSTMPLTSMIQEQSV